MDHAHRDPRLLPLHSVGSASRQHARRHRRDVVRGDVVLMVIVDDDDVPQVGRFVIERE